MSVTPNSNVERLLSELTNFRFGSIPTIHTMNYKGASHGFPYGFNR
jgi:hypothetical protein